MSSFVKKEYTHRDDVKTEPIILHQPNIIKPLHGMNPRTILGKSWWDKNRTKAYASTDFRCLACGVPKSEALFHNWLEGHEDYEIDFENYTYRLKRIIPLCHCCHNYIHNGRLQIIYDKGEITKSKYDTIIRYGNAVLKMNGLPPRNLAWWTKEPYYREMFPELIGTWDKWSIEVEGKKYFSKFKDYDAWFDFYNG